MRVLNFCSRIDWSSGFAAWLGGNGMRWRNRAFSSKSLKAIMSLRRCATISSWLLLSASAYSAEWFILVYFKVAGGYCGSRFMNTDITQTLPQTRRIFFTALPFRLNYNIIYIFGNSVILAIIFFDLSTNFLRANTTYHARKSGLER